MTFRFRHAAAFPCWFLSLVSLRLLLAFRFDTSWADALHQGIVTGLLADLAVALLPLALSRLAAAAHPRLRVPALLAGALALYLVVLGNAGYILFFKRPLSLTLVGYGSRNLWEVRKVILDDLRMPMIQLSLALAAAALWLRRSGAVSAARLPSLARGAGLFVAALALNQMPVWLHLTRVGESPLSQNILRLWWVSWKDRACNGRVEQLRRALPGAPSLLLRYARTGHAEPRLVSEGPGSTLLRELAPSPARTRELRALLGLPPDKRPNVILLFLESARAFELLDPELGPEAYPRLRRVLGERGFHFRQAYSTAQYTVEGQFSTLCSAMDRMDGPPVYWSVPYLTARCLPELFRENGYSTYWMNPYNKDFSGKYLFESHHGTETFLDETVFRPRSAEEERGRTEWGVSDHVFFSQAWERIQEIHARGKPFFAHLLNTGTHAPPHDIEGFEVSERLRRLTAAEPSHQAYLSSVKALDAALGEFFDRFLASPVSRDTAVVLVSDHGTGLPAAYPRLSPHQQRLLWPRIIFGVVSAGLRKPGAIDYSVHQLDVAPLIAAIAALQGKTTWIGRDPLLGSGTPWVRTQGTGISYRTPRQLCIESSSLGRVECWAADALTDPLLSASLPESREDTELTRQLREVVQASEALIEQGDLGYQAKPLIPLENSRR